MTTAFASFISMDVGICGTWLFGDDDRSIERFALMSLLSRRRHRHFCCRLQMLNVRRGHRGVYESSDIIRNRRYCSFIFGSNSNTFYG